ncbi:MAG: transglutaminase domain-containing protein [Planctomycetes bacterium]|nr:transglutaminase domain-containing protein [Planctomycetota bacterium]
MRSWKACCLAVILCAGAIRAEEQQGKLTEDVWEAAHLEGARSGYFRTTVHEIDRDGQKLLRTNQALNLTVRRYGETVQLRMESGTDETKDGKVVGVSMKIPQPGGALVLTGKLEDGKMHVDIPSQRIKRQLPWDDKVIGQYAQERLFQKNKAKPGNRFTFKSFEPTINAVVTVRVAVHDEEDVDLVGVKKRLVRATLVSDRVEVPGVSLQLPPMTVWLGKDSLPVARQVEIDGIGKIMLTRTTRARAQAPIDTARLPDIGLKTLLPLNRRISRAYATTAVVYRVTVNDDSPETALARDGRQEVKNVEGKTFELHVTARRMPEDGKEEKVGKEFLASCYYLNSDDVKVKEFAKKAVGDADGDWDRARRVAHWVHDNMHTDASVPFAPAGQVARQLRGDCRQHAMLAAAMCRAVGVPSRTAVGLVYVEDRLRRPVLGFHMWFEVFVKGQWLALDAIFGPDGIGATHIKIADHSWYDTQSLTPLLPVTRVLGKMRIEVVQVESQR